MTIWNLHLLHQDVTRKPSHLPVPPFQPESPDPPRGSYLHHPCSVASGGPARPPDLSYAGQSHNDSSIMLFIVALPSNQNISTHLQWISVLDQEWINSLKFCLTRNVKAKSFSVIALAMSLLLMLITVLFLYGCRQGMYFNWTNPVNSLKFYTLPSPIIQYTTQISLSSNCSQILFLTQSVMSKEHCHLFDIHSLLCYWQFTSQIIWDCSKLYQYPLLCFWKWNCSGTEMRIFNGWNA